MFWVVGLCGEIKIVIIEIKMMINSKNIEIMVVLFFFKWCYEFWIKFKEGVVICLCFFLVFFCNGRNLFVGIFVIVL